MIRFNQFVKMLGWSALVLANLVTGNTPKASAPSSSLLEESAKPKSPPTRPKLRSANLCKTKTLQGEELRDVLARLEKKKAREAAKIKEAVDARTLDDIVIDKTD